MPRDICQRCGSELPAAGPSTAGVCPACGYVQPAGDDLFDAAERVQIARPQPPPAGQFTSSPQGRLPSREAVPLPRRSSRRLWLILLGAGVPIAIAVLAFVFLRSSAQGASGLDLIPGDAAAFVSVRVHDSWAEGSLHPEMRGLLELDVNKALQRVCGLELADLERVTAVFPTLPQGEHDKLDFWAVVKTKKAYSRDRIRACLAKEVREQEHEGKSYLVSPEGALHFFADDLLVFATPNGMKDFLARKTTASGPLRKGIDQAEKHNLVIALKSPLANHPLGVDEDMDMKAIVPAELMILAITPQERHFAMNLALDFADDSAAKGAESELRKFARARPEGGWKDLLKDYDVSRSKGRVVVTAKTPIDDDRKVSFRGKHFSVVAGTEHVTDDEFRLIRKQHYDYLMYRTVHIGSTFRKRHQQENPNDEDIRRVETTYYARRGPAGIALEKFNWFRGPAKTWSADARLPVSLVGLAASGLGATPLPTGPLAAPWSEPPYGVVGLATGTMAAYARPYQHVEFFNGHPDFVSLSLPAEGKQPYFHYIRDAQARGAVLRIRNGSPRALLAQSRTEGFFHALFVDTYKEAVETIWEDLLTREGMALCMSKLAPEGVLCYHISNRYYNLVPVVADVAASLGLSCRAGHDWAPWKEARAMTHFSSHWIMVARKAHHLDHLVEPAGYRELNKQPEPYWSNPVPTGKHVWTDQARPFQGLYHNDPELSIVKSAGVNRHATWYLPAMQKARNVDRLLDAPLNAFSSFLLANRNKD